MVTCIFCNKKFGCRKIHAHYIDCIPNHNLTKTGYLVKFTGQSIYDKHHFIYAFVGEKTRLSNIDKFLRKQWCECCNHLSEFRQKQLSKYNELVPTIVHKKTEINKFKIDDLITYNYDFCSTTTITIKIIKKLMDSDTSSNNNYIEHILNNDPYVMKCSTENCKNCALYYIDCETFCINCSEEHEHNESKLLIVNSPRSGICGYE